MSSRGGPPVFVVGSINQDYVLSVERRPDPGETLSGATLAVHPGGKGANQAVAAARLGARVAMLGRVGDDPAGAALREALAAQGVDTAAVLATPQAPSGSAFITVTPDGENAIVVVPGANRELVPGDVDAVAAALRDTAVLVAQLEVPVETVGRAVSVAAGAGTLVVLNLAPARPVPGALLARVDVLVVNEHEAGFLLGEAVDGSDAGAAARAAVELRRRGPRAVVVTLGAAGAVAADAGGAEHLPAPPARVVDTTGAGDAFVGALAARLAAGASLPGAVAYGVRAGAAAVRGAGAQSSFPAAADLEPRPDPGE
jgi:ribokinase